MRDHNKRLFSYNVSLSQHYSLLHSTLITVSTSSLQYRMVETGCVPAGQHLMSFQELHCLTDLRAYGVAESEFVSSIDNFSVAQATPAPLKVFDVAGHAVGFV